MTSQSVRPPSATCSEAREHMLTVLEHFAPDTVMTLDSGFPTTGLSNTQQAFLKGHISQCQACHAYGQSLFHLSQSLSDIKDVPVPAGLADRIMARLDFGVSEQETSPAEMPSAIPATPLPPRSSSLADASAELTASSSKRLQIAWIRPVSIAAAVLVVVMSAPMVYQGLHVDNAPNRGNLAQLPASSTTHSILPSMPSLTPSDFASRQALSAAQQSVARQATFKNSASGIMSTTSQATSHQPAEVAPSLPKSQVAQHQTMDGQPRNGSVNKQTQVALSSKSGFGVTTAETQRATAIVNVRTPRPAATRSSRAINSGSYRVSKPYVSTTTFASVPASGETSKASSVVGTTLDSIQGQELAYDPLSGVLGSEWLDSAADAIQAEDAMKTAEGDVYYDPLTTLMGF